MNYSETSIFIDNNEIPLVNTNNHNTFLHKSIILYGRSGTGKTFLIKDILYILKDIIPLVFVINPTNELHQSYTNLIPNPHIHKEVTEEFCNNILERQKMSMAIYQQVNNIKNLEKMFFKCATTNEKYFLEKIINTYEIQKQKCEINISHHASRKNRLTNLNNIHNQSLIQFYKKTIEKHRQELINEHISNLEKTILKNLMINPNILLIIDDCAKDANKWSKFDSIKEIFFNGRHYNVTTLIALQDDKSLTNDIRLNAFINIFTTKDCAISYFNNKSNNCCTTKEKKIYEKLADKIFETIPNEKNYKKLCYIREDPKFNIQYILANDHDDFRVCSDLVWQYTERVKKNQKNEIDARNQFFNNFN